MPKVSHDVIPGFTAIAASIWEYLPTFPCNTSSEKLDIGLDPSLILLFSWTGAHGRHVAKYAQIYQTIFPTSRILIVTTSAKDLLIRTSKSKQALLRPAVRRILSYGICGDILIHTFSEGGSHKAVEFAEAYYKITGTRLSYSALCMDSTPGHPRYLRFCNALAKSLPPHPILRYTGLAISGIFLGFIWVLYGCIKGYNNNLISKTRRRIMDSTYWDVTRPRCYLYGEADAMIAWKDIEEHAIDALKRGVPVANVRFENSDHCKHALEYPERYWNAVKITWGRAQSKEKDVPTTPEKVLVRSSWSEVASQKSEITLCSPVSNIGITV